MPKSIDYKIGLNAVLHPLVDEDIVSATSNSGF